MDIEEAKKFHYKRYRDIERRLKAGETTEDEKRDLIAYRRLHGAGFFDSIKNRVKDFFSYRKAFSDSDTIFYNSVKDKRIVKLEVVRTPLGYLAQTFSDIATLGQFSQTAKKLGYDRVYHLYIQFTLEDGTQVLYEKNETVVFRKASPPRGDKTSAMVVQVPADMTVGQFVSTAQQKMSSEDYWHYNVKKGLNCQKFVRDNLQANGLLTPELEKFIMQDAQALISGASSGVQNLSQIGIDVGAFLRKLTGSGLEEGSGM